VGGDEKQSSGYGYSKTGDSRINHAPEGFDRTSDSGYTQGDRKIVNDPKELESLLSILKRVGIMDLALPPEIMRQNPTNDSVLPNAASRFAIILMTTYEVRDARGLLVAEGENRNQPIKEARMRAKKFGEMSVKFPCEVTRVTVETEIIGWVIE